VSSVGGGGRGRRRSRSQAAERVAPAATTVGASAGTERLHPRAAPGAAEVHLPMPGAADAAAAEPAAELSATMLSLLGLLNLGPMSGYDMKQIADRSLRFFFPISYGQIYPNLELLAADGLIEALAETDTTARGRRAYRITDDGVRALRAWLYRETEPTRTRSELLAKLLLAAPLDPRRTREMIETHRDWVQARLEVVRFNREAVPDPPANLDATIAWGETLLGAELEWCEKADGLLAKLGES
jgi:DNA-binding PadR family transcriptional regulator